MTITFLFDHNLCVTVHKSVFFTFEGRTLLESLPISRPTTSGDRLVGSGKSLLTVLSNAIC
ncbi:hypothetical protein FPOAC1_010905 [Fusarium poae]|uniref:hypothetical protein n=1 Tax=Fusarium poae TaxID=36050 RepID=UPI001CE86EBD|nr:hypothetical protein FPOAC1_010905 [Fusarium poae]KAG8666102.1 hypothetical protein FPOAC1_010905 [Fusarium poae]